MRDATPAPGGPFPGVVFSHGMAGHRRQSTFLCTHLASHGFVVASPDHVGNTLPEMLPLFMPIDAAGIEVVWLDHTHYRTYPQLHGEFRHDVSVLDLLLHVGPEAPAYVRETA